MKKGDYRGTRRVLGLYKTKTEASKLKRKLDKEGVYKNVRVSKASGRLVRNYRTD